METVHADRYFDPPSEETCTAHNCSKPCRECWLAELEFKAEIAREEAQGGHDG